MHAPKSPLRKGPSYSGPPRSSHAPHKINAVEINPIPPKVGQIRRAADNYSTSLAHAEDLSRAILDLSGFYLTAKFSETDVMPLVEAIGSLGMLSLPSTDIRNISRFVIKSARVDQPNLSFFKLSAIVGIFEILLSDLCRSLQREEIVESCEHICDVLLALAYILQNSAGVVSRYRHSSIRVCLLLYSHTLGATFQIPSNTVVQLKLQTSVTEVLGYAYSIADVKLSPASSSSSESCPALRPLLESLFPGAGASESKLNTQVLELLISTFRSSQLFIQALRTASVASNESEPATYSAKTSATAEALYHTTSAQLALLVASLRALHLIFDHAQSLARTAAKKTGAKAVSALVLRLNHRNALLGALDPLLKDAIGLLGKRLDAVAEGMSSATASKAHSSSYSASVRTTPTAAATSAFAKAAYRPPSQRNNTAGTAITSTTTHSASIPANTLPSISSANACGAVLLTQRDRVLQWALTFLGSLAAHDPGLFLTNWKQFLTESPAVEDALEAKCSAVCGAVAALSSGGSGMSGATSSRNRTDVGGINSSNNVSSNRPVFRPANKAVHSPLLYSMLRNNNALVRAAAVGAIVKLLSGLQLASFFSSRTPGTIGSVRGGAGTVNTVNVRSASTSRLPAATGIGRARTDDAGKYLQKITSALIVLLNTEQQEEVVELLCRLSALLLSHMPLSKVLSDRVLPVSVSSRSNSIYEVQAVTIYHLILRISLRFEIPFNGYNVTSNVAVSTSSALNVVTKPTDSVNVEGKSITASYIAMSWVIERCKGFDQSQAFVQAIQLPYLSSEGTQDTNHRKLHSASVSSIGSSSSASIIGVHLQSSYIYAAVHCLLRAIPPIVTNNLYCITVRTLNTALAQYHPTLYLLDTPWLCNLLNILETHAQPALRLQGSKMLSFLLEYDLRSVPGRLVSKMGLFGVDSENIHFVPGGGNYVTDALSVSSECYLHTYQQCRVVGRSLQETVTALHRGCVDDAHIVRTQAMLTLGALSPYVWRVLHGVNSVSLDGNNSAASVRVQLLRCLLVGTTDTIGTVRASAYKSLGDCVVHLCLLVSAPDVETEVESAYSLVTNMSASHITPQPRVHSLWTCTEESLLVEMMHALNSGIADTKLAVRIQAAWALGNALINVIPYRWNHLHLSRDSRFGGAPALQLPWLQDEAWVNTYTELLPLLKDSDKMLATAVRCIGNIIAGMFASYAPSHRECITTLHKELIQQYLVPEYELVESEGHPFDHHLFDNVKVPILEHSQKLIFALSQTMGFIFHASVSSWDESSAVPSKRSKSQESVNYLSSVHIREIMELQIHFLRHGKLKIQLQAVQVLLYMVAKHSELINSSVHRSESIEDDNRLKDYISQLVRLLECLFVLTRTTLSGGISTKHVSTTTTTMTTTLAASSGSANSRLTAHASSSHMNTTSAAHTPTIASMSTVIDSVLQSEQGEETETRAEVVQLFRSRATQLLHYFVLLLHSVVAQLWSIAGARGRPDVAQAVLELLVFYGEDVTTWMEALQAQHTNTPSVLTSSGGTLYTSHHSSGSNSANNLTDAHPHGTHAPNTTCGFSYSSANTSVGLPHVQYDVTVELGVQNRTPQVLVAETCANLLRFTLPQRSLSFASTAASSEETSLSLLSPDTAAASYRPERLPNVLSTRLENIAQYAPFVIQSLYHDAYSVTGGISHSYGVFDGLDHSHLYVPVVGSPVRSPNKVHGTQHSGGGTGLYSPHDTAPYGLPSVQDGEEDEF